MKKTWIMKKEGKNSEADGKRAARLNTCMMSYFDVQGYAGISDDMDTDTKVKVLVKTGVDEMRKMDEIENDIVDRDYSEVSVMLNIPISKQQYKEFVAIMSKIKSGEYLDRNRMRYEEQVRQKLFDQCIREKFLESVINSYSEEIPVPDVNGMAYRNVAAGDDREFNEVIARSVGKHMEARNVHGVMLSKLGEAFEYVMELQWNAKEYKELVEWKYMTGGVPGEKSAPKLFSLFYKFARAFRMAERFCPDEASELAFEVGLSVEGKEPMPREGHFPWWPKDAIDRWCPTMKDDYYDWLGEQ